MSDAIDHVTHQIIDHHPIYKRAQIRRKFYTDTSTMNTPNWIGAATVIGSRQDLANLKHTYMHTVHYTICALTYDIFLDKTSKTTHDRHIPWSTYK